MFLLFNFWVCDQCCGFPSNGFEHFMIIDISPFRLVLWIKITNSPSPKLSWYHCQSFIHSFASISYRFYNLKLVLLLQDLIDKARTTLVGNRISLQRLQASTGVSITNDADDPAYINFNQVLHFILIILAWYEYFWYGTVFVFGWEINNI